MSRSVNGYVTVRQGDKILAEGSNRVVLSGLELFAKRLELGNSEALPSEFRVGDSGALTTDEMTELQGSLIAKVPAVLTRRGSTLSWQGTLNFPGPDLTTCREIGLFQGAEAGNTMVARFLPIRSFQIKKGSELRITWEIKLGD